jgi:hypothetical protein
MRPFHTRRALAVVLLSAVSLAAGRAQAQQLTTPGLFPLPAPAAYPTYTLAPAPDRYFQGASERFPSDFLPGPSDVASQDRRRNTGYEPRAGIWPALQRWRTNWRTGYSRWPGLWPAVR